MRDYSACKIFFWCLEANLKLKDIQIIVWRYGRQKTLKEVGNIVYPRITREAIRQREKIALKHLKYFLLNHDKGQIFETQKKTPDFRPGLSSPD